MVPEKNFQNSWKVLTNLKYMLISKINFKYMLISRINLRVLFFVILGFWTTMKSKSTGGCKRCTFQIGLIQQKYFPFPIYWSRRWQKIFLKTNPLFPAPGIDFDSAKRSCLWPFEVSERPPVGWSSNKLSAQLWSFVYLFVLCSTLKQPPSSWLSSNNLSANFL